METEVSAHPHMGVIAVGPPPLSLTPPTLLEITLYAPPETTMSHLHHYPMPFLASPVLSSPRPLTLHSPHPRHDFQPRSFLPLAASVGYQEVYEGTPTWAAGYDSVASGPRGCAMDGDFDEEGHNLQVSLTLTSRVDAGSRS